MSKSKRDIQVLKLVIICQCSPPRSAYSWYSLHLHGLDGTIIRCYQATYLWWSSSGQCIFGASADIQTRCHCSPRVQGIALTLYSGWSLPEERRRKIDIFYYRIPRLCLGMSLYRWSCQGFIHLPTKFPFNVVNLSHFVCRKISSGITAWSPKKI